MIYIEIFKLDWLFIDTVIIILLLMFLFSVKFFKLKSRWRYSLSNKSLLRIKFKKSGLIDEGNIYSIRKMNIVRNMKVKDQDRPKTCIITLITKNQTKVNRLLTSGLSSYGFDVINIKINTCNDYYDLTEKEYEKGIKKLKAIINSTIQKIEISMSSYMLILDSKSVLLSSNLLFQNENKAVLLINPKINSNFKRKVSSILLNEHLKRKILIIFNKKTFLLLNNINFLKFSKLLPDYKKRKLNIKILEKSRKSFKYYETFLLGMTIDFLEANI